MTGKHVELRARQMQHFQGIYFLCSEDLCGSDRTAPRRLRSPRGPRFHPGLRCMRGAEAQRRASVRDFFWVRTLGARFAGTHPASEFATLCPALTTLSVS